MIQQQGQRHGYPSSLANRDHLFIFLLKDRTISYSKHCVDATELSSSLRNIETIATNCYNYAI